MSNGPREVDIVGEIVHQKPSLHNLCANGKSLGVRVFGRFHCLRYIFVNTKYYVMLRGKLHKTDFYVTVRVPTAVPLASDRTS